jgi:NarL family two-component system response regulator LiaR
LEFEPGLKVVAEGDSGVAAISIASQYHPDVMLLDLAMPGMDGMEATEQIKQVSANTQIIILTSYYDDDLVLPVLRAGALSYILKDINAEELVNVVRKAAKGEAILNPRVAARVVQEVRKPSPDNLTQLSEREYEVLLLIANGYSNAGIAERLVISERTAKSHVSSILTKLNMTDRTQLAIYAWQRGLVSRYAKPRLTEPLQMQDPTAAFL